MTDNLFLKQRKYLEIEKIKAKKKREIFSYLQKKNTSSKMASKNLRRYARTIKVRVTYSVF